MPKLRLAPPLRINLILKKRYDKVKPYSYVAVKFVLIKPADNGLGKLLKHSS